jgi:hypothetical protein
MAGLLDDIRTAEQARARGLLSHTPQQRVTGRQGADAMQSVGLLASPIPVVGDVAGLLGDAAMYAAKPEERTLGNVGLTALAALPGVPPLAGKAKKVLDMSDDARAARMAEQGYVRGLWRGGKSVADGPFYTPDAQAAADFARRHGANADVREYALRMGKQFDTSANFGPEDLQRLAEVLGTKYGNKMAAKELPSMASDFRSGRMPGAALYQVLEAQSGGNAADVLRAAGYDSLNAGQEVRMLNMGNVRDANKAAFDPRHLGKVGPFLGLAGLGLLGINEDSVK